MRAVLWAKEIAEHRPAWILVAVVVAATVFGAYAAIELRQSQATCEQLNDVIKQTNIRGTVLKRLLIHAAEAREASALLDTSSPPQRRIDQRAAYLYRLDADIIKDVERVSC